MNAASHIHGKMHAKVFKEILQLRKDVDEWTIDEDLPHPQDEKNFLRPDISAWRKGVRILVIEVCLASNGKDYGSAKYFYQECGINEYLIVDINKTKVVRFTLQNGTYIEASDQLSNELEKLVFK